jgi:prolyl-tRNA synthetase
MVVEADAGMIGGSAAHEFMLVTPSGEDSLILCPGCNYTANADVAVFDKGAPDFGPPEPIDEVPTPDCKTIEVVATFLGVSTSQTMKAVFYIADDRFVFVVIRGDLGVNKTKLRNRLGVAEIRPATDKEIRAAGAVPGYASPIGLSSEMTVVVDDSVERMTNAVAGANKDGYHVRHVNFPRDFTASLVGDVALAVEGATCAHCGGVLQEANGVEVGHIFKLGDKYSKVMGATYLDDTGRQRPLIMGCYGIGVGRLLAAAVEANYDDDGIVFPISVAPFEVHLVPVGRGVEAVKAADLLYDEWTAAGIEVLYDDRDESPGVKFKDSDLIGIPIRITVSARTLEQDAYEVKCRWKPDREIVPRGTFDLRAYVDQAWAEVASTVASANGEPA